jgi:hypothetical protein
MNGITRISMSRGLLILLLSLYSLVAGAQPNRSVDGFGNNLSNPSWGSTGSVMARWTSNGFGDSINEPAGLFRPNARLVSNLLLAQDQEVPDERGLTEFVWVFGQFIDHDITLVSQNRAEMLPIKIPSNDDYFLPGSLMPFFRSLASTGSGSSAVNPRQYDNEVTAFIDASTVYGSDDLRAAWLRTFQHGKLKTSSGNLLPWNTPDGEFNSPADPDAPYMDNETGLSTKYFVAGDIRANEHPLLIAMHTLFVREHNRICDSLVQLYPHWDDETVYQKARKNVGALIQSITYREWLPALGIRVDASLPYDPATDPSISNVFSAAAFRLGHTMITDEIVLVSDPDDPAGNLAIPLKQAFFNPLLVPLSGGLEPFLQGIAHRVQQKVDLHVVDGVRNFLFGDPNAGGLDLPAMNIMRGRDRGLPDYNTMRQDMGLPALSGFDQLTADPELADRFTFLYGNIDNVDPWVGMLAEPARDSSIAGELMTLLLEEQFSRLLQGDRFYFENDPGLTPAEKERFRHTRLSEVIIRNTTLDELPDNVFIYRALPEPDRGPDLLPGQLDAVIYPVPAQDVVNVKFFLEDPVPVTLSLIDAFGRSLWIETLDVLPGDNLVRITLDPGLPSGLYLVTLSTDERLRTFRLRKD